MGRGEASHIARRLFVLGRTIFNQMPLFPASIARVGQIFKKNILRFFTKLGDKIHLNRKMIQISHFNKDSGAMQFGS